MRRRATTRGWLGQIGVGVVLAILPGCASTKTPVTTAPIPAGSYASAFAAAKDALREAHFDLRRVDAAAGVITTHPRFSAGLATPWLDYDETFSDSVNDLVHRDRRLARVEFVPADEPNASALVDRRAVEGPLLMTVTVEVERTYVTGWRADSTSIRLTSRTIDPQLADQGLYPLARDVVGEDEKLASRIVSAIEEKSTAKSGS